MVQERGLPHLTASTLLWHSAHSSRTLGRIELANGSGKADLAAEWGGRAPREQTSRLMKQTEPRSDPVSQSPYITFLCVSLTIFNAIKRQRIASLMGSSYGSAVWTKTHRTEGKKLTALDREHGPEGSLKLPRLCPKGMGSSFLKRVTQGYFIFFMWGFLKAWWHLQNIHQMTKPL